MDSRIVRRLAVLCTALALLALGTVGSASANTAPAVPLNCSTEVIAEFSLTQTNLTVGLTDHSYIPFAEDCGAVIAGGFSAIIVKWGDGTYTRLAQNGTAVNHIYIEPRTYTIHETVWLAYPETPFVQNESNYSAVVTTTSPAIHTAWTPTEILCRVHPVLHAKNCWTVDPPLPRRTTGPIW
jgi:hypothetical protein